jgi:F-type H+-transporting ATPase subunit beta
MTNSIDKINMLIGHQCSGLARSFGAAALRRPTSVQRTFRPITKSFAPALSARFASSDSAKDGKIHQVIGAVVDGK